MPIIQTKYEIPNNVILVSRLIAGLVWFFTVLRRLLSPNFDNFEGRISSMAEGNTLFPQFFMDFAVNYWYLIFGLILSIEILSAISLLLGIYARGGSLLATVNGFAIGMAGVGIDLINLVIPWSVAILTLFLLLFTHPGRYKGLDNKLQNLDLPRFLLILT